MKKLILSLLGLWMLLVVAGLLFLTVGAIAESELLIVLAIMVVVGLGVKFSPNKARQ